MKKCNQLLASVGLLAIASTSQAMVIDFQAEAYNMGESAWSTLNTVSDLGYAAPDIDITADPNGAYAYLDAVSGGKPAGLGVCSTGLVAGGSTGQQAKGSKTNVCFDGADDNVDIRGEALNFTFNEQNALRAIWFNNNHDGGSLTGNTVLLSKNGGAAVQYTFLASDLLAAGGFGYYVDLAAVGFNTTFGVNDYFTVAYDAANGTDRNGNPLGQFYVSAIDVPEPGPLALLGLGLIGFYAASKKKAA